MSVLNLMGNEGLASTSSFRPVICSISRPRSSIILPRGSGTAISFSIWKESRMGGSSWNWPRNPPSRSWPLNPTSPVRTIHRLLPHGFPFQQRQGCERRLSAVRDHPVYDATTLGNDLKILRLPPMKGRNLAIISRSGGHAVIAPTPVRCPGSSWRLFPRSSSRNRAPLPGLRDQTDQSFDLGICSTWKST